MNALKVRLSILSSLMALAAVIFVFSAEPATAQQRIRITEGQVAPTPIAIAEFTNLGGEISDAGRQIAEIISNDLLSSGLFDPIDNAAFIAPPKSPAIRPNFANWAPLGAKGLLVGSAEIDADGKLQVEFVLWDVITQRNITSGSGNAAPMVCASWPTKLLISFMRNSPGIRVTLIRRLSMSRVRNAIPPRQTSGDHGSGWA